MSGILYVVATPIGNLEDISYRAIRILGEVDLIAAEDTRHSRKLLVHYGLRTPLISYQEHNEAVRSQQLCERLRGGESIALISDAGTPCLADPGYRLVALCHQEGIRVAPVPGASALLAALAVAGLPTDQFHFAGFIPAKKGQRQTFLQNIGAQQQTLIAYEAPHRLRACLEDICHCLGGDRQLVIARELTKLHEELFRGSASAAWDHFAARPVRGEIVLLLAPLRAPVPPESLDEALLRLLAAGEMSLRQISKEVARQQGVPASEAYARAIQLREH